MMTRCDKIMWEMGAWNFCRNKAVNCFFFAKIELCLFFFFFVVVVVVVVVV